MAADEGLPPELEHELSVHGLGFELLNTEKRLFKISPKSATRIVENMKARGYVTGNYDYENIPKLGTEYIFSFGPAGTKDKIQRFRLRYYLGELRAVIDIDELEDSRLPIEEKLSVSDLASKRMKKFVLAVENARGGYAMRAPPPAPAGPAAAGAGGDDPYGMAAAFARMGVREGGRRRTKRRKSTVRRGKKSLRRK
jgi:hypothetical protein